MFYLRPAEPKDINGLHDFGHNQGFINLPSEKENIEEKIECSIKAFSNPSTKIEDNYYVFVLEDTKKNKVVGCSMIHGKHGTEPEPHVFLKSYEEKLFSPSLGVEKFHKFLQFGTEPNGYTEIGGLFLSNNYRASPHKLGKQLSYIRFIYMGLHKSQFTDLIHTELLPILDDHGNSPLWDNLGRKFIDMPYKKADELSRKNKDFIPSLFPSKPIYIQLLPQNAQEVVGKVGAKAQPVKAMLEKIGFSYTGEIDPLDGGPHYRAALGDISLIKQLKVYTLRTTPPVKETTNYLVTTLEDHKWLSCVISGRVEGDELITDFKDNHLLDGCSVAALPF